MAERIAFLGLGVMGFPMAGHLARAGHGLRIYNRTATRSAHWLKTYCAGVDGVHGDAFDTPARAAREAAWVMCCVGNDEDLREVLLGPTGALAAMEPGSILVDHTTASASLARELAVRAAERGVGFLDAPVSGGQSGAEEGVLTVMVGGEQEIFERAQPVIDAYARCIRLLGPAGSGQLAKMVNQICIAGLVEGLAEGLHFARRAGLDAEAVVEVISQGAAQSWQMDHRAETMLEGRFDFGFAVDWMRKDLAIALAEARSCGARLPVAALVDQLYAEVQSMGGGRWDTSSLLARLERETGAEEQRTRGVGDGSGSK